MLSPGVLFLSGGVNCVLFLNDKKAALPFPLPAPLGCGRVCLTLGRKECGEFDMENIKK